MESPNSTLQGLSAQEPEFDLDCSGFCPQWEYRNSLSLQAYQGGMDPNLVFAAHFTSTPEGYDLSQEKSILRRISQQPSKLKELKLTPSSIYNREENLTVESVSQNSNKKIKKKLSETKSTKERKSSKKKNSNKMQNTIEISKEDFNQTFKGLAYIDDDVVHLIQDVFEMLRGLLKNENKSNDFAAFNPSFPRSKKQQKVSIEPLSSNLSLEELLPNLSLQDFIPNKLDFIIQRTTENTDSITKILVKPNAELNMEINQYINKLGDTKINKNFCKSVFGNQLGAKLTGSANLFKDKLSYKNLKNCLNNQKGIFPATTGLKYDRFLSGFLDIIENPDFEYIRDKDFGEERKRTYAVELKSVCLAFEQVKSQMSEGGFKIDFRSGPKALPSRDKRLESGVGAVYLELTKIDTYCKQKEFLDYSLNSPQYLQEHADLEIPDLFDHEVSESEPKENLKMEMEIQNFQSHLFDFDSETAIVNNPILFWGSEQN